MEEPMAAKKAKQSHYRMQSQQFVNIMEEALAIYFNVPTKRPQLNSAICRWICKSLWKMQHVTQVCESGLMFKLELIELVEHVAKMLKVEVPTIIVADSPAYDIHLVMTKQHRGVWVPKKGVPHVREHHFEELSVIDLAEKLKAQEVVQ
jgi:hypothetical protein